MQEQRVNELNRETMKLLTPPLLRVVGAIICEVPPSAIIMGSELLPMVRNSSHNRVLLRSSPQDILSKLL
jgi:hypothetical protein